MKLSVAMCTYNGERYLREQLEALGAQTRLPDELIVCDDGSADETVRIVFDFAARVPFPVRVHTSKQNLGSTRNFEQAIRLCQGDIIALCDQDDVWLPEKLARLETEFANAPEVGLVFTDAEVVDEQLRPLGYSLWEKLGFGGKEIERLRHGSGFDALLQGSTVTGATAAFRARFRALVLPIPNDIPLIHDAWLALLIAATSEVLPIPEMLIKYRQHSGQQVGAVERRGSPRGFAAAFHGLRRKNPYAEMIAVALSVRDRLLDQQSEFDGRKAIVDLEARIAHLEARSKLPRAFLPRANLVLRELFTVRYHRYSKGLSSAAKDLVARGTAS